MISLSAGPWASRAHRDTRRAGPEWGLAASRSHARFATGWLLDSTAGRPAADATLVVDGLEAAVGPNVESPLGCCGRLPLRRPSRLGPLRQCSRPIGGYPTHIKRATAMARRWTAPAGQLRQGPCHPPVVRSPVVPAATRLTRHAGSRSDLDAGRASLGSPRRVGHPGGLLPRRPPPAGARDSTACPTADGGEDRADGGGVGRQPARMSAGTWWRRVTPATPRPS